MRGLHKGNSPLARKVKAWTGGARRAPVRDVITQLNQLKHLAERIFRRERASHTLQPTAFVNELFERLIGSGVDWHDRNHFYALSARMMRRVLVNYAQAKRADKRGGDALRVTLREDSVGGGTDDVDLIAVDEALEALALIGVFVPISGYTA